jgi:hypothetical protein
MMDKEDFSPVDHEYGYGEINLLMNVRHAARRVAKGGHA